MANSMQLYLLRYGEIGTKSPTVRSNFVSILVQNIERMFLNQQREIFIEKRGFGRIFGYTKQEDSGIFSRIFGLVSYSPVEEISSDLDEIKRRSKSFAEGKQGSFAVRARRTGDQDYSSMDVEEAVGAVILDENPDLVVDLDDPDNTLYIEVRNNKAYLFTKKYEGPGGLPLSSQGKAAAFVEEREDFLATWLMMKRGVRCYVYYTEENEWIDRLKGWDPNLKSLKINERNHLFDDKLTEEIDAVVLGETMEDITETKTDKLIFRPLIGFSKSMIEDKIERIKVLENSKN
ncbi:MAG: THUMP domain-containing protein [Thermoplasmatota archaeon]